jgi:putative membrane protein
LLISSDAAENYNGQQGDIWDAQKDMAMAVLGIYTLV